MIKRWNHAHVVLLFLTLLIWFARLLEAVK